VRDRLKPQSPRGVSAFVQTFCRELIMPNVKTVKHLLARIAQQQDEYMALSQALESIAAALTVLHAELQSQKSTQAPRRKRRSKIASPETSGDVV